MCIKRLPLNLRGHLLFMPRQRPMEYQEFDFVYYIQRTLGFSILSTSTLPIQAAIKHRLATMRPLILQTPRSSAFLVEGPSEMLFTISLLPIRCIPLASASERHRGEPPYNLPFQSFPGEGPESNSPHMSPVAYLMYTIGERQRRAAALHCRLPRGTAKSY